MAKIIKIEIDCGEETCDDCEGLCFVQAFIGVDYSLPACCIFPVDLDGHGEKNAYRCEQCKNAEVTQCPNNSQ